MRVSELDTAAALAIISDVLFCFLSRLNLMVIFFLPCRAKLIVYLQNPINLAGELGIPHLGL